MVNTNIGDRNLKCFELYFESMITIRIYDSIESIRSNSNSFEIFTLEVIEIELSILNRHAYNCVNLYYRSHSITYV